MRVQIRLVAALLAVVVGASACSGPSTRSTAAGASPSSVRTPAMSPTAEPMPTEVPAGSEAASPSPAPAAPSPTAGLVTDDPLLLAELTDVRSGATFTLAELAAHEPVLVETMAIWCTNCRQQMRQVTAAHELADFQSVSIDVDPGEVAGDLAAYAEREGWDWPFVLADAELATLLRERFGPEVMLPPGMPKLLVRPDGSIELLPLGELLDAEELAAVVDA